MNDKKNFEEFKVWGEWKVPTKGVQYAMGGGGVSFTVGKWGLLNKAEKEAEARLMINAFIAGLEIELETRAQSLIEEKVKEKQDKRVEELEKQLDLAREEYLKLKNDK